jgi:immunity protein 21 of polymorphic toxin system
MLYSYSGELRWLESNGGPLLLVPGERLPSWEGTEPPADGRQIDAQFRWNGQDAPATDYDRACDVKGWLGLLDVGAGQAIVLGGEPLGTAWQAAAAGGESDDNTCGILIRPVYANSEADVIEALKHVRETVWQDTGLLLSVGREPLYLLDAAYPGSELEGDDHLTIELPPGRYSIATAEYEPDSHTSLLLHRLTRMSSGTV